MTEIDQLIQNMDEQKMNQILKRLKATSNSMYFIEETHQYFDAQTDKKITGASELLEVITKPYYQKHYVDEAYKIAKGIIGTRTHRLAQDTFESGQRISSQD